MNLIDEDRNREYNHKAVDRNIDYLNEDREKDDVLPSNH